MKVGDQTSAGQTIREIFGLSSTCCVFTTTDNNLRWAYFKDNGTLPEIHHETVSHFNSVMRHIKLHIPTEQKPAQYALLGKSLYRALHSSNIDQAKSCFDEVSAETINLALQATRIRYVALCLVATIIIVMMALAISYFFGLLIDYRDFVIGGLFGSVGALVSVLHRVTSLDLDWRASTIMSAVEAGARMFAGFCFGLVFILLSKSNLVLGTIKDVAFALWSFAFVAGFSERFVPQLIEQIQTHVVKSKGRSSR